jgi:hypothetical protein
MANKIFSSKCASIKGSNLSSPSFSEPPSPQNSNMKIFILDEPKDKEKIIHLESEIKSLKE